MDRHPRRRWSERSGGPALALREAEQRNLAAVFGYHAMRHDNLVRRLSSRISNWVHRLVLGSHLKDAGCAIKVVRRSVWDGLPAFHGSQCFLADLLIARGARIAEIAVTPRPRITGMAKYGISNRLGSGLHDLIGVRWLARRQRVWEINETAFLGQTQSAVMPEE